MAFGVSSAVTPQLGRRSPTHGVQTPRSPGQLGTRPYDQGVQTPKPQSYTPNAAQKPIIPQVIGGYASDLARINSQIASQTAQIPFTNSLFDMKGSHLQQNIGLDQKSLGLKRNELGVDRGAVAREQAYIDALKGMTGEDRALTEARLGQTAEVDTRNINSDYTGRGAWFAPMRGSKLSDVEKEKQFGMTAADISYRRDILGLDKQRGDADDRKAKIDLMGQQLGINGEKLQAQLEQGLQELGYSRFMSVNDLINGIGSGNAQKEAIMQQIIMDALKFADVLQGGSLGDTYSGYTG